MLLENHLPAGDLKRLIGPPLGRHYHELSRKSLKNGKIVEIDLRWATANILSLNWIFEIGGSLSSSYFDVMFETFPSFDEFSIEFASEEECIRHMFKVRYGEDHACPTCGKLGPWYLNVQRAFGCSRCGIQLRPKSGTVYNHSKTTMLDHFRTIYLSCASTYGMPADELAIFLGLPKPTAWTIANRVRRHIAALRDPRPIGGKGKIVEIDETLLPGVRCRPGFKKHVNIFGITDGRDFLTFIVPDRKPATLLPIVDKWIRAGSEVHTDGFGTYRLLDAQRFRHRVVNHKAGFMVSKDGASTVRIDQFWGRLKRTIRRVYNGVHYSHLETYLKECEQRAFWKSDRVGFLNAVLSRFPVSAS